MKHFFSLVLVLCTTVVVTVAQDRTIKGTVTDSDGSAIAGATIQLKGTKGGAYSKKDGSYTIKAGSTGATLEFRSIGKLFKEVVLGTSDVVNVSMDDDESTESEVVVTAIGLGRSKKSLGYATQEIKSDEIINSRETNIVNALASRVAGVQVNSSTGVPGASSYIRIRGSASLTGNNQPLFVVDGIPIDNSQVASENTVASVAYSNRAMDIDPNSIESMNVLKGPAATALYGIRAAGGAIIITTKKGKATEGGKINVNVSGSWAFDQVNKLPELQNQYSQGAGGRYAFSTGASRSWGAKIDTLYYDGNANYKWDRRGAIVGKSNPAAQTQVTPINNYDSFFRTGLTQNQSVTLSGGSSTANFLLSFSNLVADGVVPNSTWARRNLKLSSSAVIAPNLTASANINYANSGGTRIQQGSNVSGVMLGLVRTPPTFDNANGYGKDALNTPGAYMFADGTQRTYRAGAGYDNPFFTVNENPFTDNVNRVFGNIQLDWGITKGLDLMYRVGMDYYNDRREQFFAKNARTFPSGRNFTDENNLTDITSDLILTYNVDLTDDIHLQALAGQNLYSNNFAFSYVQRDGAGALGQPPPPLYASTIASSNNTGKHTMAYYGDIRLDYRDALFLNITGRNEWSTTLPEANNSFFYPSVSAAAVLTELVPSMKSDALSYLKVRANVASVGKDAPFGGTITGYSRGGFADGWTSGITFPFSSVIGLSRNDLLANPDLKPESTTSYELGFDAAFLDGRITLDVNYYYQLSDNQIFAVPIASSSGYSSQLKNAGSMSNSGIEAVLGITPIKTADFSWNMLFNFTRNVNRVEKLAPGVDNIFLGGFSGSSVRAVEGQPYGSIYGFGWARDASGNVLIDDDPNSDNYGYPILDTEEKSFGNFNPDFLLGIRNTFTWKGLSLGIQLDIRQGGVMWNGTRGALYFFGTHKETESREGNKVFTGVKASDGASNDIEVPYGESWLSLGNGNGFYGSNTEDFIEDASWIRLRELTLSYAIPTEIMAATPFSGLTVAFTGRNLWLSTPYTGVDPETSLLGASSGQGLDYFNMPGTKSFVFSFNLNF